jgi:hypothetical protein
MTMMKKISAMAIAAAMAATMAGGTAISASADDVSASDSSISVNSESLSEAKQKYLDLLDGARALPKEDYSEDSYALFTKRLQEYDVSSVITMGYEYADYEYEKLCKGIEYAKSLLNPDTSHTYYADFEIILEKCESIVPDDYTEESYNAFLTQYNKYKDRYTLEKAREYEDKGKGINIYTSYIVNYQSWLNLLVSKNYKETVLEDEATGLKLCADENMIPENSILTVDKFDSNNWVWEGLNSTSFSNLENLCSVYECYSFTLSDADGSRVDMNNKFTVTLPVPERFDMNNLTVELYKNSCSKGSIGKMTVDKENRLITVEFTSQSYLYMANGASLLLKNPITAVDPLTLTNDGVYSIHSELTTYSSASQASMANSALVHDAYLVKKDDDVDVYLDFVPIYVFGPDTPSYCGGLWSERGEKSDNDWYFDSETVLSYYTDDFGMIMDNESYNGVTEIPCVKTIKLHLERDCYNEFGGYTLVVSSPSMASMNGLKFEEIIMDQLTCNLMISEPVYLGTYEQASSYLPGYDYSALKRELQYVDTLSEADYTAESWQSVESALKNAEKVTTTSTSDEIEQSVNEIKEAVSNLVIDENKNNKLPDGRYLLNADMLQTDRETKSMSDNAINHTVTLDVVNGEYYVNVEFKGLTINNDFGYLSKLSYYDTGYTYDNFGNPKGTTVSAETLTSYDVVDKYNTVDTPYPHYLRFKLVDKANGEYVPLQVFVPIMEAIQEGGGTQNVLMKLDWTTLKEAGSASQLNGYSISLAGDIGLNFFMNLSDEVLADSGAKVCITLPDGSIENVLVSSVTPNESGYKFTAHVAAKEMTSDVTVQILLSDGTKGDAYTYTVKEYADTILADTNTSAKTKKFVKAMLNYGGYAQEYFSYNTANIANADFTADEKSLDAVTEDELSFYDYSLRGSDDGISYKGSKLSLESNTVIKHYFALADGKSISDYTFKVNGSVVTPVKSGDMYYITVENISAQNLGTDYTVQVGKLRLAYSPMSYAYSALTKTDKIVLQNVTKALYLYNQAADEYINS